jgi:hypothetical protein
MVELIKEAEVPYQIITIPEECEEILNDLDIKVFPTIIKMQKGKITAKYEGNPQETIKHMKLGE